MSQLSVDSITGRVAGTSPTFPNGFQVTGIVTATTLNQTVTGATSFQGSTTFDNGFTVTGATGIVTAYLPEQDTFAVMFSDNRWITFKETEEDFLKRCKYETVYKENKNKDN